MLKRIQVFYLAKESNSILLFSHRLGWNTDFYFNIPRIQKSDTCQCRYDKYFLNGNSLTFFQSKICNCCNDLRIQLPTDMWIRVKPLFTCSLSDSGSMLTEAAFFMSYYAVSGFKSATPSLIFGDMASTSTEKLMSSFLLLYWVS